MTNKFFSFRTNWDLSENPLSSALKEIKASGTEVLDLTESNPTQAGFSYPPDFFLPPLHTPASLTYDPSSTGMLKAREAVAAYYKARGVEVPADRLVLTASTSEAYSFLFRLLMNPGERVLIPAPSYPLFYYLAGLNDVEVAYYRMVLDNGAWRIDFDSLEAALAEGPAKAVILVSPNNPTGSFVKRAEFARLNALCLKRSMAIVSDEVFGDYVFDAHKADYVSAAANTGALSFALSGLSKAMALPQMKLGWIAVNGPRELADEALARLDVIADTYLSVNTPVQHAAVEWLPKSHIIRDQIMARVAENFGFLTKAVAGQENAKLLPVEGGWYAVLKMTLDLPEDEWALRLLREKKVYVHPGFYFDFEDEGCLVLSLLPQPEKFVRGIGAVLGF